MELTEGIMEPYIVNEVYDSYKQTEDMQLPWHHHHADQKDD